MYMHKYDKTYMLMIIPLPVNYIYVLALDELQEVDIHVMELQVL